MKLVFSEQALGGPSLPAGAGQKLLQRINALIKECARTPFEGVGKPEPLRGNLRGWWSRRIDREHRLVYRVQDDALQIAQCRYHD